MLQTGHTPDLTLSRPSATTILIAGLNKRADGWPLQLALHRLEESGYWLESAYWASLHGKLEHVASALRRLSFVRMEMESMLRRHADSLSGWLSVADEWLTLLGRESRDRNAHEQEVLLGSEAPWTRGLML